MQVNRDRVQSCLKQFEFELLFVESLGWDNYAQPLQLIIDDRLYSLNAIAQKRGLIVYVCEADLEGKIPNSIIRSKIDTEVTKYSREHLIIYVDRAKSEQKWQWVRREIGATTRRREFSFHRSQSGEALIQRLEAIAFSLAEEEILTAAEVQRRTRKAFDLDQVTKKFYTRFAKEHQIFLDFIKGIQSQLDHEWYASLMLNRLMFVYFIQKKGFLNGDTDYLRHRLEECQAKFRGNDQFYSFYRYFLLKLFHEGLGNSKRDGIEDLLGRVPYLNGGLFEVHDLEKENPELQIPDAAFERIFDFFDEYQWHLDDRPLKNDREINPDVLGYIFEKYINQKQMGAYYTKEDITEYISKNTIIPFLFNAVEKVYPAAFRPKDRIWKLLKENPDRYIYNAVRKGVIDDMGTAIALPNEIAAGVQNVDQRGGWNRPADQAIALPTETWREFVARRDRCLDIRQKLVNGEIHSIDDLITHNLDIRQFAQDVIETCDDPDLLRAFYGATSNVTCLDPTCGSGAFLFAAANILEPLYDACLERMQMFLDDLERSDKIHRPEKFNDFRQTLDYVSIHPNRTYFILKSIIINNLFGVDIMREATEICKLRLFLKLVSQVKPNLNLPNYGLDPLPDIDFNIRAGNTLVGFVNYDQVKQAIEGAGQKKLDLRGDMQRIDERAEIADRAFQMFRKMQTEQSMKSEQFTSGKVELRERLKELNQELNRYLASQYGVDADKPKAFQEWIDSHQPFHWFIEFYSTMKRGGFDVIIGNPPYVQYSKVENFYQVKNYEVEKSGNLYAFITERSSRLLMPYGFLGMIVPMSLVSTQNMSSVSKLILNQMSKVHLSHYSGNRNPGILFEGVEMRLTIVLGKKKCKNEGAIHFFTTDFLRWGTEARKNLFFSMSYYEFKRDFELDGLLPKISTSYSSSILEKIYSKNKRIANFIWNKGEHIIYAHRIASYFVKCFNFVPFFFNERDGIKKSEDYKLFAFRSSREALISSAIINSTLFYFFYITYSDTYHCGRELLLNFPVEIDQMQASLGDRLIQLNSDLMQDLQRKSSRSKIQYKGTGWVEFDKFYPKESKAIIDEIDRVLAKHYGFTDEELDFIINYDIKYRMGRDANDE